QENRGVSGALNTAIRNSRGQYISWLSSDDAYHPDKVWEQVKVLDARPDLGWVYSDFYYIDANSTPTGRANVAPLDNESFVEKMFEGNPVHGCSVMFRRSNLEKTGLFDETLGGKIGYGADGALWHKMGYHFKFEFINKPLVYYRLHPGQVTHQADIPKHKEEYRVYMNRYFDSVRAENESVDSAPAVIATRFESVDPGERLGFNADPDFPEQKPTGQRILWIGTADPCGNAAMYARAVNRHTEHLCRVVTFKETRGFDQDIVLRRQRWAGDDGFSNELTPAEESRLRDLAERADILVFSACSYSKMGLPATRMDDTDQLKWGKIDWADYSSHKPCVAFFFGSTATRANANWYWDLFSQQKKWRVATGQLDLKRRWKDALYVPTWLDVDAPRYRREIVAARNTLVVQTPTDPPIKNSRELESAVRDLLPDYPNLSLAIKTGLSYQEALELKRQGQIALDQMQVNDGYYCMSSLENSALGLVNFVYVDQFGLDKIAETLKTDKMPWHIVKNESELRAGIKSLLDDPDRIFETQRETYAWMRQHWHPSRLVHYLTDAILN
ncbi:MAG: glycosyltransferase, partial [Candidatus Zixiibacteriota bacterium]